MQLDKKHGFIRMFAVAIVLRSNTESLQDKLNSNPLVKR